MNTRHKLGKRRITVLDIGCGKGACTWFLGKEGAEVTAIDGSPSAICQVPTLLNEFRVEKKINIILGDITKPREYIHSNFDILLDNYSIYSNPEKEIVDAYIDYFDILSNGGYFLTNCFGEKTTGFGTGKRISQNTWAEIQEGKLNGMGLVTFFNRQRLNKLFKKIGYTIHYTECLSEKRNGIRAEKLVTCLTK